MTNLKCPSCGSPNVEQIDTNKYQCPYCGKTFTSSEASHSQLANQPQVSNIQNSSVDDKPGCLMNGICFIIPLVGLIMYFVKKNTQPNCAKSYIIWAAVGFGISILLNLSGFWEAFWEGFYGY